MNYTSEQKVFQRILRIYEWLLQRSYGLNQKIGEIKVNYIVKNDNPDVGFTIEVGEVLDSEGNPIPQPQLTIEVGSSDENVLAVKYDNDTKQGSARFVNAGIAAFAVQVKDEKGNILGSGGDSFTVTLGDPASISSVTTTFEGLMPVE